MLGLIVAAGPPIAIAIGQESKSQQRADKAHTMEIEAAQKAAEAWLQVQDREQYEASWKAASSYFQQQVPQTAWVRRMNAVRKPLDPVLSRTLNTAEYKKELPGLARGVYVALVWETAFRDGHPSLESLVMKEENGQWKMVGYAAQ